MSRRERPNALPPTPEGPACPTCGEHHTMSLAKDWTERSRLTFQHGKWFKDGLSRSEPIETDGSVRMFCTNCGEYFAPPEELCEL